MSHDSEDVNQKQKIILKQHSKTDLKDKFPITK